MTSFTLNGAAVRAQLPDGTPLLHALRGEFALNGPRFGCGEEQCGSCMVLVDGAPAYACTLPVAAVAGKVVVTAEGLGTPEAPHPLQAALLAEQAGQCGWCLAGVLVSASALLARDAAPSEEEIRAALDPHLCRCGSHNRIVRAVQRAAQEMRA